MTKFTIGETWDLIIENGIASDQSLQVATDLLGYNLETLNDVIYILTGYRDIYQFIESENF